MRSSRALAAVALAVTTATAAAACSSGSSSSSPTAAPSANSASSASTTAKVTLTWWNNATNQPLLGIYEAAIKGFEAKNPNVTITNVPVQNELLQDTKIPLALEGNNPPNIYQQWGGGVLGQQVTSGKVANITADVSSWISGVSGASGWQANGQQYGVPVDLHVVGFWYRKDIFSKVGITVPTTLAQLESDDAKLRAAGYAPIAVGSKDRWPDAFWWEYFALRDCRAVGHQERELLRIVLRHGEHRPGDVPQDQPVPDRLPRHLVPAGRGQLSRHGRVGQGRDGAPGRLGPVGHGGRLHQQ
jgi:raffinose/stachyose/melibiose transport system substrate-binding protein